MQTETTTASAEELMRFADLVAVYYRFHGDSGLKPGTLYKYAKVGLRNIKLKTVRKGRLLSSVRWLDEFYAAVEAAANKPK